jgi:uncharacterized protein (TIGR02246 family)
MIKKMVLLIALALGIAGCGDSKPPEQPAAQASSELCARTNPDEIRRLFTRWNDALKDKTAQTVVGLYADDSILLPTLSDEARIAKDKKLAYFKKFTAEEPSAVIDPKVNMIEIGACNMAVDSGYYTFRFTRPKPDTPNPLRARYTFVYKYFGGKGWLIVSHHSSVMPPPNPHVEE